MLGFAMVMVVEWVVVEEEMRVKYSDVGMSFCNSTMDLRIGQNLW